MRLNQNMHLTDYGQGCMSLLNFELQNFYYIKKASHRQAYCS